MLYNAVGEPASPLNPITSFLLYSFLDQPSFAELRDFPGPLVPGRTHKGEVIQFCQSKIAGLATAGRSGASATTVGGGNSTLGGSAAWMTGDKDSYVLLWELLILLLRQKNTIDGSDIAELLLKDRKDVHRPYRAQVFFL